MVASKLIREARLRAGLSQRALAERLGTQQPAVARWESGDRSPDFETVARVVRACGLELRISLEDADPQEDQLIHQYLALDPEQRLLHNRRMLETERWAASLKEVPRG